MAGEGHAGTGAPGGSWPGSVGPRGSVMVPGQVAANCWPHILLHFAILLWSPQDRFTHTILLAQLSLDGGGGEGATRGLQGAGGWLSGPPLPAALGPH